MSKGNIFQLLINPKSPYYVQNLIEEEILVPDKCNVSVNGYKVYTFNQAKVGERGISVVSAFFKKGVTCYKSAQESSEEEKGVENWNAFKFEGDLLVSIDAYVIVDEKDIVILIDRDQSDQSDGNKYCVYSNGERFTDIRGNICYSVLVDVHKSLGSKQIMEEEKVIITREEKTLEDKVDRLLILLHLKNDYYYDDKPKPNSFDVSNLGYLYDVIRILLNDNNILFSEDGFILYKSKKYTIEEFKWCIIIPRLDELNDANELESTISSMKSYYEEDMIEIAQFMQSNYDKVTTLPLMQFISNKGNKKIIALRILKIISYYYTDKVLNKDRNEILGGECCDISGIDVKKSDKNKYRKILSKFSEYICPKNIVLCPQSMDYAKRMSEKSGIAARVLITENERCEAISSVFYKVYTQINIGKNNNMINMINVYDTACSDKISDSINICQEYETKPANYTFIKRIPFDGSDCQSTIEFNEGCTLDEHNKLVIESKHRNQPILQIITNQNIDTYRCRCISLSKEVNKNTYRFAFGSNEEENTLLISILCKLLEQAETKIDLLEKLNIWNFLIRLEEYTKMEKRYSNTSDNIQSRYMDFNFKLLSNQLKISNYFRCVKDCVHRIASGCSYSGDVSVQEYTTESSGVVKYLRLCMTLLIQQISKQGKINKSNPEEKKLSLKRRQSMLQIIAIYRMIQSIEKGNSEKEKLMNLTITIKDILIHTDMVVGLVKYYNGDTLPIDYKHLIHIIRNLSLINILNCKEMRDAIVYSISSYIIHAVTNEMSMSMNDKKNIENEIRKINLYISNNNIDCLNDMKIECIKNNSSYHVYTDNSSVNAKDYDVLYDAFDCVASTDVTGTMKKMQTNINNAVAFIEGEKLQRSTSTIYQLSMFTITPPIARILCSVVEKYDREKNSEVSGFFNNLLETFYNENTSKLITTIGTSLSSSGSREIYNEEDFQSYIVMILDEAKKECIKNRNNTTLIKALENTSSILRRNYKEEEKGFGPDFVRYDRGGYAISDWISNNIGENGSLSLIDGLSKSGCYIY